MKCLKLRNLFWVYQLLILQNDGVLSLCLIVKNPWWILQCTSVYNVIKLKEKDQRGFRLTNFPEQLIQLHAIKESWNSVITFWIDGIQLGIPTCFVKSFMNEWKNHVLFVIVIEFWNGYK